MAVAVEHTAMKASLSFLLACLLPFSAAFGGSATWGLNPTDGDWNTAANWTPPTVPDGRSDIATFDVSNLTQVSFSGLIQLEAIVFTPGASSYNIASPTSDYARLIFGGEGIVNNSSVEQRFDAWPFFGNTIEFRNSASAGNAHFKAHSGAVIAFYDTATAEEATFDNTPAGVHDSMAGTHSSSVPPLPVMQLLTTTRGLGTAPPLSSWTRRGPAQRPW